MQLQLFDVTRGDDVDFIEQGAHTSMLATPHMWRPLVLHTANQTQLERIHEGLQLVQLCLLLHAGSSHRLHIELLHQVFGVGNATGLQLRCQVRQVHPAEGTCNQLPVLVLVPRVVELAGVQCAPAQPYHTAVSHMQHVQQVRCKACEQHLCTTAIASESVLKGFRLRRWKFIITTRRRRSAFHAAHARAMVLEASRSTHMLQHTTRDS